MRDLRERQVKVNGFPCRVWEKGDGPTVVYLAGPCGLSRWTPFLDELAGKRRVVAPSLPGFPGATGHAVLDDMLDWILATRDLLWSADVRQGDLIGVSVAGALAAEVAAVFPDMVNRLVLCAPFGIFDPEEPLADIWAQREGATVMADLFCARSERYLELVKAPEGVDFIEWEIIQNRAAEAAIRYLYPFGDTGVAKRLPRIAHRTLLLRGSEDRVVPVGYPQRWARLLANSRAVAIPGAGHLADLDEPAAVAQAIEAFLSAP